MSFTPQQVDALRTLARVWSTRRFVLIGASALDCQMRLRSRQTHDLDLVLAANKEAYSAGLEREPGWARDSKLEHRWSASGDVRVDVIPAGDPASPHDTLTWPMSGNVMNLAGLRLAFERSVALEVAPGLMVHVAPIEVVALLKMVAYLDRPAERERDLADIAQIMDEFVSASDDRRWSSEVFDLELKEDEIPSFFLGRSLSIMMNRVERELVRNFIAKVRNTGDPSGTQARMLTVAPHGWGRDPEALLSRIKAMERGLGG